MEKCACVAVLTLVGLAACSNDPINPGESYLSPTSTAKLPTSGPTNQGQANTSFVLAPVSQNENTTSPPPANLISLAVPKLCADIPNADDQAGVALGLWNCNGVAPAQDWSLNGGSVQSTGSLCLGVPHSDTLTSGAQPTLYTCSAADSSQHWNYQSGHLQIASSQLCLAQSGDQGGTYLTLLSCDPNNTAENWGLAANDGNQVRGLWINNPAANVCLDTLTETGSGDATIFAQSCNGLPSQQWVWERDALRSAGKCASVASDKQTVVLSDCNGTPSQEWALLDGQIVSLAYSQCLTTTSGMLGGGLPLQLTPCQTVATQNWSLGWHP